MRGGVPGSGDDHASVVCFRHCSGTGRDHGRARSWGGPPVGRRGGAGLYKTGLCMPCVNVQCLFGVALVRRPGRVGLYVGGMGAAASTDKLCFGGPPLPELLHGPPHRGRRPLWAVRLSGTSRRSSTVRAGRTVRLDRKRFQRRHRRRARCARARRVACPLPARHGGHRGRRHSGGGNDQRPAPPARVRPAAPHGRTAARPPPLFSRPPRAPPTPVG